MKMCLAEAVECRCKQRQEIRGGGEEGFDRTQENGSDLKSQYERGFFFFFLPLLFSPKSVFICWPAEKQLLNHKGKTNDTVVGTRLCFMCRLGGEGGGSMTDFCTLFPKAKTRRGDRLRTE